jgi:hypothetical protein
VEKNEMNDKWKKMKNEMNDKWGLHLIPLENEY